MISQMTHSTSWAEVAFYDANLVDYIIFATAVASSCYINAQISLDEQLICINLTQLEQCNSINIDLTFILAEVQLSFASIYSQSMCYVYDRRALKHAKGLTISNVQVLVSG